MARDPALETAVMDVLWESDTHLNPAEVRKQLEVDRAYTTVMTVLVRLWNKGLLERVKQGKAYVYKPIVDRDAVLAANMIDLVERAGEAGPVLARFAAHLDPAEREHLARLLKDH
jgi:predicted transcriptional regulator